jgi:outer membrane protein assembly factor BamB
MTHLDSLKRGRRRSLGSGRASSLTADPRLWTVAVAYLVVLGSAWPTRAADWPQWGGTPGKNMASQEKGLPQSFVPGDKDTRTGTVRLDTAKNVRWARKVCESTYSSPVIAGGKVFLGGQEDGGGVVVCLEEQTGRELWRWHADASRSFGICATPAVEEDRLYVVDPNAVAVCLDVNGQADGEQRRARVLWRFDMHRELKTESADTYCGSCVVDGEFVYVPTSNGIDPLGDSRWGGTLNNNDGRYEGMAEIIATPVVYKDRVYVAMGRDAAMGRGRGALHCIDASKTGEVTDSGRIWTYQGLDWTSSTVSIADELLFVADVIGRLHCLDAETGQCYWIHETKATQMLGSTLAADGKVYMPTSKGLFVFVASKEKVILDQINLGAPPLLHAGRGERHALRGLQQGLALGSAPVTPGPR